MLNYFKKLLILTLLFSNLFVFAQKKGYNIKIKVENYKNDTLFLGNYYGDKQYIKDTAILNLKGIYLFSGEETLPGGVYLVITNDRRYFELIIDKEQFFSVETKNEDLPKFMKIKDSPDNEVFYNFQNFNRVKYEAVDPIQKRYAVIKDNKDLKDSVKILKDKLQALNTEISDYKLKFIKDNPNHLMAKVFKASKDIDVPDAPKLPGGGIDSMFAYKYYKAHYWDNFDLTDDRILRTPVFHGRLENYFKNIIIQSNDSIKSNCDDMIERTRPNKEMFKYTLWFLTNFYEKSQIMGQDEIFVYLSEKYYATNQAYWVTPSTLESIMKRVKHLKPTLIGTRAPELIMPDTTDAYVSSFGHKSHFTMILFWDTDCGHCKIEVPKVKEFYDKNKKRFDIEVYAIDTDHDLDRWKKYIRENKHTWISVSGMKTNIDYHDVYDIYSTPVIFLLDKDFKVIAKRLGIEQVEDFLQHYLDREKKGIK